jgi:hypothetical protein
MSTFRNILSVPSSKASRYEVWSTAVTLHTYSPMKMEHTKCAETLTFKLQTPGNNPEEGIRNSKHGEILKSRRKNYINVKNWRFKYSGISCCPDWYLLTFRGKLLPPSLGLKKYHNRFLDFLYLEDGGRNILRNVDKYIPIYPPS